MWIYWEQIIHSDIYMQRLSLLYKDSISISFCTAHIGIHVLWCDLIKQSKMFCVLILFLDLSHHLLFVSVVAV